MLKELIFIVSSYVPSALQSCFWNKTFWKRVVMLLVLKIDYRASPV